MWTIILVWLISGCIIRRFILEEDIPLWIRLLRIILAPVILVFEFIGIMWIGITSHKNISSITQQE